MGLSDCIPAAHTEYARHPLSGLEGTNTRYQLQKLKQTSPVQLLELNTLCSAGLTVSPPLLWLVSSLLCPTHRKLSPPNCY